jgi:hypothetical protein
VYGVGLSGCFHKKDSLQSDLFSVSFSDLWRMGSCFFWRLFPTFFVVMLHHLSPGCSNLGATGYAEDGPLMEISISREESSQSSKS